MTDVNELKKLLDSYTPPDDLGLPPGYGVIKLQTIRDVLERADALAALLEDYRMDHDLNPPKGGDCRCPTCIRTVAALAAYRGTR